MTTQQQYIAKLLSKSHKQCSEQHQTSATLEMGFQYIVRGIKFDIIAVFVGIDKQNSPPENPFKYLL